VAEWVIAAMIVLNLVCVIIETDVGAKTAKPDPPRWLRTATPCLTASFICELAFRFFVYRSRFFEDSVRIFDFLIVMTDVVIELGVKAKASSDESVTAVSVLRVFRLGRMARTLRVFVMFPELNMILRGLFSATRATMWGCVFVFITILTWSILATQIIHPLTQEVVQAGGYSSSCSRCPRAWESVWESALSITQTVLVGDGWGDLIVPIISYYPITIVFFVSTISTTQLLILNLILAVIVERASVAREEDLHEMAVMQAKKAAITQAQLRRSLAQMDRDGSGTINRTELFASYDSHEEIEEHFTALGVDRRFLTTLFELMNHDGTGEVPYREFVCNLYQFKNHDPLHVTLVLAQQMRQLQAHITKLFAVDTRSNSKETVPEYHSSNKHGPTSNLSKQTTLHLNKHSGSLAADEEDRLQQQAAVLDTLTSFVHVLNLEIKSDIDQLAKLPANNTREIEKQPRLLEALDASMKKLMCSFSVLEPVGTVTFECAKGAKAPRVLLSAGLCELYDLTKELRGACMKKQAVSSKNKSICL